MTEYVFEGRWEPTDREASLYRSLPFEVEPGAAGIVIEVDYQKTATAALDIGLSDPSGFRGWSGSSLQHVELGSGKATPGYLAGELDPGTWAVELGLHRIPYEGLQYSIRIDTNRAPALKAPRVRIDAAAREPRELPAPEGMRWLAGDLRAHSEHSDGSESVAELAERAIRAGLDFLVIADFNTVSHLKELDDINADGRIILVPGVTIATDTGHAAAIGSRRWADLRERPETWAEQIRSDGGLICANHPTKADSGWITPLEHGVDLAEVWSGGWNQRCRAALAWWMATGPGVVPVGGSGWTGPGSTAPMGSPVTWVLAHEDDVVEALRAGRTAVSESTTGPLLLPVADDLVVLGAAGLQLIAWDGRHSTICGNEERLPLPENPSFLRDGERIVALSAGRAAGTPKTRGAYRADT